MEPPPRLAFSNSSGARVSCAAHGTPAPTISWMTEDGAPVTDVPGLSLKWQQIAQDREKWEALEQALT
ncbi:unnamed protein product [Chilo suppressalis]|uniref:Ig-like domain-containing protein n=1 Tax=Chilo suppressalis TaxID=168631 RepID=A0ABN8BDE3_CHISP|nr:unnamed protein product [Chilo suppressalis]